MRCLFCKKEIGNATSFCPECGQKLEQYIQSPEIENYWSEVNKADSQRNSQLTFNDESSLDYAFISTTGPKEEDELPQYEGTYNYTVSRTITGSYKISTDGKVYELKVNDNNEVTGISRK